MEVARQTLGYGPAYPVLGPSRSSKAQGLSCSSLLFADHEPNKRKWPSIVRPAELSEAAKTKVARRQTGDGTPIMARRDLIANLGTLTINEVELPAAERRTFHMLARATGLQE